MASSGGHRRLHLGAASIGLGAMLFAATPQAVADTDSSVAGAGTPSTASPAAPSQGDPHSPRVGNSRGGSRLVAADRTAPPAQSDTQYRHRAGVHRGATRGAAANLTADDPARVAVGTVGADPLISDKFTPTPAGSSPVEWAVNPTAASSGPPTNATTGPLPGGSAPAGTDNQAVGAATATAPAGAAIATTSGPTGTALGQVPAPAYPAPVTTPVTWRSIVTDTLSWIGLGALGTDLPIPANPVPDILAGIWIGVRRLHYTLFNSAPTLSPTQPVVDPETGVVTGSLGGFDPDGDVITYTLTSAPAEGTVEIDADGTWTYTATPACGCTVDTDSFTITATDTGPANPVHVRTAIAQLLSRFGLTPPAPVKSVATITVTDIAVGCSANGASKRAFSCAAPTLPAWVGRLKTYPTTMISSDWYEYAMIHPNGFEQQGMWGASLMRARGDAPMELSAWGYLQDDGTKGTIKNYSNQIVMVEMRHPYSMEGQLYYEVHKAILLPGDHLHYTLSDASGGLERDDESLYFYAMDDEGNRRFAARLNIVDPYWGRPDTYFHPANTDFVGHRGDWDEGDSHHEIWGGTKLWIKRENDGWSIPYSDAWYAWKQKSLSETNRQLINTPAMDDWNVFTIHIDSL